MVAYAHTLPREIAPRWINQGDQIALHASVKRPIRTANAVARASHSDIVWWDVVYEPTLVGPDAPKELVQCGPGGNFVELDHVGTHRLLLERNGVRVRTYLRENEQVVVRIPVDVALAKTVYDYDAPAPRQAPGENTRALPMRHLPVGTEGHALGRETPEGDGALWEGERESNLSTEE